MMRAKIRYITFLGGMAFLLIGVWGIHAFAANWYKDYDQAKKAAERGDWSTAIELFQQAINADPEPDARKRTYGVRFIEYYPYLELGKAYLAIGDKQAAKQACETAQAKGKAPQKEIEQCLSLAATVSASVKAKQDKLIVFLQQKLISPEHFNCAFKMLESEQPNPLLDGLLSGEIGLEVFNRTFSCETK